jgi:hypothetical protein
VPPKIKVPAMRLSSKSNSCHFYLSPAEDLQRAPCYIRPSNSSEGASVPDMVLGLNFGVQSCSLPFWGLLILAYGQVYNKRDLDTNGSARLDGSQGYPETCNPRTKHGYQSADPDRCRTPEDLRDSRGGGHSYYRPGQIASRSLGHILRATRKTVKIE